MTFYTDYINQFLPHKDLMETLGWRKIQFGHSEDYFNKDIELNKNTKDPLNENAVHAISTYHEVY